jgi:NADH dehydrogenase
MAEIVDYVLAVTGRRRLVVPVPTFIARLGASVLQWLPKPPLTVDQVRQLREDNVVGQSAAAAQLTLEGLGIPATAIETVVPTYLYRYRRSGQFTRLPAL